MVIIHVVVNIKPEHQAEFVSQEQKFMAAAQQMAGCRSFSLYKDVHQENTFAIYETWETPADFENYQQSDLFSQYRASIGPMLMGEPASNYYNAAPLTN
ncbi:MAG: antibiotic biosynthesis monooxygenase [Anaerolineae bacterium]|nr:antibiotic biosynthesis monooxygenase [Anaerolineae bacterium]